MGATVILVAMMGVGLVSIAVAGICAETVAADEEVEVSDRETDSAELLSRATGDFLLSKVTTEMSKPDVGLLVGTADAAGLAFALVGWLTLFFLNPIIEAAVVRMPPLFDLRTALGAAGWEPAEAEDIVLRCAVYSERRGRG